MTPRTNLQVRDQRWTLRFEQAIAIPENWQLLAEAIGAEFRPNHWHRRRTVTDIRATEIDVQGERFVPRLRLWPFYEFAVEFSAVTVAEEPLDRRGPVRPRIPTPR